MNRFVAKLNDGTWALCSRTSKTLKIRRLTKEQPSPETYPSDTTKTLLVTPRHSLRTIAHYLEAHGHVQYSNLAGWSFERDRQDWLEAVSVFENLPPRDETADDETRHARLVPRTRLRYFYKLLRDLPASSTRRSLASDLADKPKTLAALVQESLDHLQLRYTNENEPMFPEANRTERSGSRGFADLVPSLAKEYGLPLSFTKSRQVYKHVAVEVAPLRTTRSHWEDGLPAINSGHGGIDLILASADKYPAVAEIKAETDTDMFLALIQTLTYATELLVPSQYRRLCKSHPGSFNELEPGEGTDMQRADILILVEGKKHKLLDETRSLCEKMSSIEVFRDFIRRIGVFDAKPWVDSKAASEPVLLWHVDFQPAG